MTDWFVLVDLIAPDGVAYTRMTQTREETAQAAAELGIKKLRLAEGWEPGRVIVLPAVETTTFLAIPAARYTVEPA